MRVLHLLKTGTGAAWAFQQIRELTRAGVAVEVAMPAGPRVDAYRRLGVEVHECQPGLVPTRPATWRPAVHTIADLVRRVDPDLVHSHFVDTTLAMRRALAGTPVPRVFQVPGPLHLEHSPTRAIEIRSAAQQDHWIATCTWVRERYLRSGISGERVHLSYYGTDPLRFTLPRHSGRLRAELGLRPATRLIGMVAHMYAPKRYLGQARGLKGHEDLLQAARTLLDQRYDVHVVLVGGPWAGAVAYEARLRALGQALLPGRHTFLGHRDDIPEIYADLDVAVHPSHSENLGAAAESLLAGVPTVATDVGGFPDIVQPGRTGWLVPRRDPTALAGAVATALADPDGARRLARAGQDLTRQLLDVERTSAEVHRTYRMILA